jgi:hypothetical protein
VICNQIVWNKLLVIAAAAAAAATVNWNLSICMVFFEVRRFFIILLMVVFDEVVWRLFTVIFAAVSTAATAAIAGILSTCMFVL